MGKEQARLESRLAELRTRVEQAQEDGDLEQIEGLIAEIDDAADEVLLQEARRDPNRFVEYCFTDKHANSLEQGVLHEAWQGLIRHDEWNPEGYARAMIVAPRDHGKCVPDDQRITLANGQRVCAVDLPEKFDVLTWTESRGWHTAKSKKWRQSVQQTTEIKTQTGRTVRVSNEHPLWTRNGWVTASLLSVGDCIASKNGDNTALLWEQIASMRRCAPERTWSIEVEGSHTHLVENFVTHNTTQIPIGRALWELGRNPNIRIKIACQSDGKAMERLFEITDLLERNERVQRVFPHLKPANRGSWTRHKIVVEREVFSKDASIEALGILSTATGGRCDLLIADDIVDRRNAIQFPQIRETIKHAWASDWTNLLEPDGRVVYICTLWHTSDLSHSLLTNPAYAVLSHAITSDLRAMEADFKPPKSDKRNPAKTWDEPLWEHWSEEALADRKEEIGTVEFDRAFRNIALSGEIIVVQPSMIKYFDPSELPDHLASFQGFDLAISKKAHADYFACVTSAVDIDTGLIYILDAWHGRLSFMQQARAIVDEFLVHEPEEQWVEVVSYQDSLPQYLDAIVGKRFKDVDESWTVTRGEGTTLEVLDEPVIGPARVPQLPIVRKRPVLDKMSRLKRITPYLEKQRVLFHPRLNPRSDDFVRERGDLISELVQFPLAKHDDLGDAFVLAVGAAVRALNAATVDDSDGPELETNVRVIGAI